MSDGFAETTAKKFHFFPRSDDAITISTVYTEINFPSFLKRLNRYVKTVSKPDRKMKPKSQIASFLKLSNIRNNLFHLKWLRLATCLRLVKIL